MAGELSAFCIGGVETYIARDLPDLAVVFREHGGSPLPSDDVERLDPGSMVAIGCSCGVCGGALSQTVAEWIAEEGRGFLCSQEDGDG